jgi:tRNA-dihydrouridine synthase B
LQCNFIRPQALFLAPMEGITDEVYRQTLSQTFPGWDYMACDFLRIPSVSVYPAKKILGHYGVNIYHGPLRKNNYYQILTPTNGLIEEHVDIFNELQFDWLDLNAGCPSKAVTGHAGGSFLLSDLKLLQNVVSRIRKNFKGHFTVKMRLGFKDDANFEKIIKLLGDEGVEAITVHARTREQLYKGIADWRYIEKAVKISSVPIIANGDIWTLQDIENIFSQTGCYGVMLARCALKTPWLAELYYEYKKNILGISQDQNFLNEIRKEKIPQYFKALEKNILLHDKSEEVLLNYFKSLSRYIFDDLSPDYKSQILRAQSYQQFNQLMREFCFQ